jgi:Trp operon repressor
VLGCLEQQATTPCQARTPIELLTFTLSQEQTLMYHGLMRPKGGAEALEMRRRIAGKLLKEGQGLREVARLVGASPSSIFRWKEAIDTGGQAALAT